jgi:hypothetical protein
MLTQLATLKARLGIATLDTTDDTLLTNIIKFVGGRFDGFCNRTLARQANALYEFQADVTDFCPPCYPLERIVKWELKSSEAAGWVEQTSVDHILRGCGVNLLQPLGSATDLARITYDGGYVQPGTTPSTGQIALPDVLEQAALEQSAYIYQRRNQLGIQSANGQNGSITINQGKQDLLPQVQAALQPFIRYLL